MILFLSYECRLSGVERWLSTVHKFELLALTGGVDVKTLGTSALSCTHPLSCTHTLVVCAYTHNLKT